MADDRDKKVIELSKAQRERSDRYRAKHKPGNPGRGGAQPGGGDRIKNAIDALRRLDDLKFRLPEGASTAEQYLAFEARKAIIDVMLKPKRYSQMRLAAAIQVLNEMCGKIEDRMRLDEHQVIVEIKQNPKKDPDAT